MLRVFSGSCLSMENMDHIREVKFIERPHLLTSGVDYFSEDGQPLRPRPCAETLAKVFSGSALDLNAFCPDDDGNSNNNTSNTQASGNTQPAAGTAGAGGVAPPAAATAIPPAGATLRTDPTVSAIVAGLSQQEEESAVSSKGKINVLVVGAAGYLGCHVVSKFLEAGYSVRGTVDDITDTQVIDELRAMVPEARQRLDIRELDMFQTQSYREVIRGCRYVVHCGLSAKCLQGNPSHHKVHMEAVSTLFEAVRAVTTIKRVVLVGSASILSSGPSGKDTITEKSPLAAVSPADPLPNARRVFVEEAERLCKMLHVELSVILPTLMLGPGNTREIGEGMVTIHELSISSPYVPLAPAIYRNYVDVRDVATCVIRATELEEAKGQRYIISNATMSCAEIGRMIRKVHPHLAAPVVDAPLVVTLLLATLINAKVGFRSIIRTHGRREVYSNDKAKQQLQLQVTPIEATIRDSVDEYIKHGDLPAAGPPARSAGGAAAIILFSLTAVTAATVVGIRLFKARKSM